MATTTCTTCGKLYEESSAELANAPERDCMDCWMAKRTEENLRIYQDAVTGANPRGTEKLNRALRHAWSLP